MLSLVHPWSVDSAQPRHTLSRESNSNMCQLHRCTEKEADGLLGIDSPLFVAESKKDKSQTTPRTGEDVAS